MRQSPTAEENSSSELIPEVRPVAPWRVTYVQVLPKFRLRVRFTDGLEGTVDMSGLIFSDNPGVFSVLSNPEHFGQAQISYGVVTWPGELDLAPDAMYDAIKQHGEWRL